MQIDIEFGSELVNQFKQNGKTVVFTNGCFDILHVGHVRYLQKAKKLGDVLILGLNTDSSVKKNKGDSRPINNENDRAEVLLALQSVDYIIKFDEETPYNLINKIKPHIITKGGDYKPEDVVGKDIVESYGGRVEIIEFVVGKSTTNIIEKINLK